MTELIVIALLGAAGSLSRYHLGGYVHNKTRNHSLPSERSFPAGTLLVNGVGSFILGLVTGLGLSGTLPALLVVAFGAGFCGAFTTFSTWAFDLQSALRRGCWLAFLSNLILPILLGAAAAWAGFVLGN